MEVGEIQYSDKARHLFIVKVRARAAKFLREIQMSP